MLLGVSADQLRRDPNTILRTQHRTLNHSIDVQLACDLCNGFCTPLSCMMEVLDMTRSAAISLRSVISSSVIPSAKYSCSGPDRRPASARRNPPEEGTSSDRDDHNASGEGQLPTSDTARSLLRRRNCGLF
jgi:hypothetical protein